MLCADSSLIYNRPAPDRRRKMEKLELCTGEILQDNDCLLVEKTVQMRRVVDNETNIAESKKESTNLKISAEQWSPCNSFKFKKHFFNPSFLNITGHIINFKHERMFLLICLSENEIDINFICNSQQ